MRRETLTQYLKNLLESVTEHHKNLEAGSREFVEFWEILEGQESLQMTMAHGFGGIGVLIAGDFRQVAAIRGKSLLGPSTDRNSDARLGRGTPRGDHHVPSREARPQQPRI